MTGIAARRALRAGGVLAATTALVGASGLVASSAASAAATRLIERHLSYEDQGAYEVTLPAGALFTVSAISAPGGQGYEGGAGGLGAEVHATREVLPGSASTPTVLATLTVFVAGFGEDGRFEETSEGGYPDGGNGIEGGGGGGGFSGICANGRSQNLLRLSSECVIAGGGGGGGATAKYGGGKGGAGGNAGESGKSGASEPGGGGGIFGVGGGIEGAIDVPGAGGLAGTGLEQNGEAGRPGEELLEIPFHGSGFGGIGGKGASDDGGGGGGGGCGGGGGGGGGGRGDVENPGLGGGGGGGGGSSCFNLENPTALSVTPTSELPKVEIDYVYEAQAASGGSDSGGSSGASSGGNSGAPSAPTGVVGAATAQGGESLNVPLTCEAPAGETCQMTMTLTAQEQLRGSKVIAVKASLPRVLARALRARAARAAGLASVATSGKGSRGKKSGGRKGAARGKTRKRTVTLAKATVTLLAGESETVPLAVNATGRELLKKHAKLSASLKVLGPLGGVAGKSVSTQTLVLKK